MPTKGVKHALEPDESQSKPANYTSVAKAVSKNQHGQDVKRRRTDEVEDKEMLTSKPMRVSVVKQVYAYYNDDFSNIQDAKPTKSIGEPIRQPYIPEPKMGIKISSAHQHIHPPKGFMAPAEGVKFSNDPIPFARPATSQAKRSGPRQSQNTKEAPYPPSESIILPEIDSEY
jgi:hypothetical protein